MCYFACSRVLESCDVCGVERWWKISEKVEMKKWTAAAEVAQARDERTVDYVGVMLDGEASCMSG